MDRRQFLRRTVPVVAVGLAGCAGGESTPTPTEEPGGSPTATATATDSPTATATPTDSPTSADGTPTDSPAPTATAASTSTASPTSEPASEMTVTVGPGGDLRFSPDSFTLAAGGTVTWEWESSGHNVRPSNQPGGADWTGTQGGDSRTYDTGHTYEQSFDATGEYEYYCAPHRSFGMTGSFTVE